MSFHIALAFCNDVTSLAQRVTVIRRFFFSFVLRDVDTSAAVLSWLKLIWNNQALRMSVKERFAVLKRASILTKLSLDTSRTIAAPRSSVTSHFDKPLIACCSLNAAYKCAQRGPYTNISIPCCMYTGFLRYRVISSYFSKSRRTWKTFWRNKKAKQCCLPLFLSVACSPKRFF